MAAKYPPFYTVGDLAELWGVSPTHLQRAANNYTKGNPPNTNNRARLPDGFGAVHWNTVYVIYPEEYAAEISELLGVETRIRGQQVRI